MSFFSYNFLGESMKKILLFFSLIFFLSISNVKAFETSATSSILMDIDSKRIIHAKNIHTKRSVASISKIMTAIVAIESGKLDEVVTVGDEILDAYGSGIYIKEGEEIKLIDLVYGLMLRSGNDAALSIANYVGGSVENFVIMMNEKASGLGMKNSEFNNPSGLDEKKGNYSTAYDMAILTSYAMKNEVYKQIVSTKRYKLKTNLNYYDWTNKNKLLHSYKYSTGGKTGYTEIAKRTLVTTASKDGLNLVAVTLNDGNDFLDHKNLFEAAFSTYTSYEILKKGLINIPGENYYKNSQFYLKDSFTYPFIDSEKNSITIKYELTKLKNYQNNDIVGEAVLFINNEKITSFPIYIEKIEKKENIGWFTKVLLWFKSIW